MSYRFDVRSKQQFKKDIKLCHKIEVEIAARLCIKVHAITGQWPELVPTGSDMTGAFIPKEGKVTSDPDFKINDQLVEITHSGTVCNKYFHQKVSKIDRAIREGHVLIFVNGFKVDKQPKYVWLEADTIEHFTQKAISKYGVVPHPGAGKTGPINKDAYRYDIYWFKDLWQPLPALIKNLPEQYKNILKAAKV
jgi:hypothetical protein